MMHTELVYGGSVLDGVHLVIHFKLRLEEKRTPPALN